MVNVIRFRGGSLMKCELCPRACGIDRDVNIGFCGVVNTPVIAKAFLHMWEEPCISGNKGSGAVFFSGCNLKCVYCQNYRISQENFGKKINTYDMKKIFLKLQKQGAHNINLVNPSHYMVQIIDSLKSYPILEIPVVYNTNAYEKTESLKMAKGVVDIYLPDLKYFSSETSLNYSRAEDYFEVASKAIIEMFSQVGKPIVDDTGIMQRGLIIRHLILPSHSGDSIKLLDWIKENFPKDVYVSLMSQYTPYYKAQCYTEINRRITRWEYERVVNHFIKLDFENGYIQERDSAEEKYIPEFNLSGLDYTGD